jgi:hypothetical protein
MNRWFLKIPPLLCVLFLVTVFFIPSGCKNPDEYKPPEDTLLTPPDAPTPQAPADSFVFMPGGLPTYIRLDWTPVSGADIYQLEVTFRDYNPTVTELTDNSYVLGINDTGKMGDYRWRVRAAGTGWKGGYTSWSPAKSFGVRFRPPPPNLVYPANGETIYIDSLPGGNLTFSWNRVQDEQYYEMEVLEDSAVIFGGIVSDTFYQLTIEDTAFYQWQLRAGSSHWELMTPWTGYWDFYVVRR